MGDFVDHYVVLGLPSGEEGMKLSEKEIAKGYKLKALELHPDKRPDDPEAHNKFQKLKTSYEILKDEKARGLFDDLLRVKREKQKRQIQVDSKRRKMMSDLEERERSAFAPDSAARAHDEEERIARKLKEEINRIRAKHAKKGGASETQEGGVDGKRKYDNSGGVGAGVGVQLDKERALKVSWEKLGEGYSAERLREVFSEFGEVEDVVIRSSKKKSSALVIMATKDGAVAAMGTLCGDLSNPLLVVPLQRAAQSEFQTVEKSAEEEPRSNLVGAGYQAYEDAVLEKLRKAAKKQK